MESFATTRPRRQPWPVPRPVPFSLEPDVTKLDELDELPLAGDIQLPATKLMASWNGGNPQEIPGFKLQRAVLRPVGGADSFTAKVVAFRPAVLPDAAAAAAAALAAAEAVAAENAVAPPLPEMVPS